MSPNPLDVQTIHASQNDNEARQWEFELHNNGELIDTSDVKEQLVFKAYKGGTEQLLPENGSTPTTSPFLGDIRYPQGLLTDQEFTYRESPTESDGLAKITDIKGNTLNWNQLELNDLGTATTRGVTFTKNSDGSWATSGTATSFTQKNLSSSHINTIVGHKYLFIGGAKGGSGSTYSLRPYMNGIGQGTENRDYGNGVIIEATTTDEAYGTIAVAANVNTDGLVWHPQIFDLSEMFGIGNEPTIEEFKSLFSLPYYAYNQGSLLSFNGNGIKTVSKNQFDTQVVTTSYQGLTLTKTQGTIRAVFSGGSQYAGFNFYGSPVFTDAFLKGRYRLSFDVKGLDTQWTVGLRQGATFIGGQALAISNDGHYSFTIDAEANPNCYLSFARTGNKTTAYDVTFSNIQLELGTTETSYTPFEEKTISLPISQYFPDGMKSAKNAYDELTENKAITRIGKVDMSGLAWAYRSEVGTGIFSANVTVSVPYKQVYSVGGLCAKYTYGPPVAGVSEMVNVADKSIRFYLSQGVTARTIYIKDTSFTDVNTFKQSLSGVYLYYELATPTETSFTTASLVTENAEIPLSNNDGVLIGKCTEELSAEPGFHDAKIKLSDSDGECYSNKIQLHVERSPQ